MEAKNVDWFTEGCRNTPGFIREGGVNGRVDTLGCFPVRTETVVSFL